MARAFTRDGREFLAALERRHREVLLMLDYRDQLRGRQRQVFNMKYIEGLSLEEAARRLHVATRVVGTYLQRALTRINKLMRRSAQRHAH